jgi:CreA protein
MNWTTKMSKPTLAAIVALALTSACSPAGDKVGDFNNDWTGNEFKITAVRDPAIPNVVCHFATFDRGFLDRIGKGNWFENPSNSAVDCHASGPLDEAALSRLPKNAEIASQSASLLFKATAVRRIIDIPNRSIVYLSYGREISGGSAKISMSVVPFDVGMPESTSVKPSAR